MQIFSENENVMGPTEELCPRMRNHTFHVHQIRQERDIKGHCRFTYKYDCGPLNYLKSHPDALERTRSSTVHHGHHHDRVEEFVAAAAATTAAANAERKISTRNHPHPHNGHRPPSALPKSLDLFDQGGGERQGGDVMALDLGGGGGVEASVRVAEANGTEKTAGRKTSLKAKSRQGEGFTPLLSRHSYIADDEEEEEDKESLQQSVHTRQRRANMYSKGSHTRQNHVAFADALDHSYVEVGMTEAKQSVNEDGVPGGQETMQMQPQMQGHSHSSLKMSNLQEPVYRRPDVVPAPVNDSDFPSQAPNSVNPLQASSTQNSYPSTSPSQNQGRQRAFYVETIDASSSGETRKKEVKVVSSSTKQAAEAVSTCSYQAAEFLSSNPVWKSSKEETQGIAFQHPREFRVAPLPESGAQSMSSGVPPGASASSGATTSAGSEAAADPTEETSLLTKPTGKEGKDSIPNKRSDWQTNERLITSVDSSSSPSSKLDSLITQLNLLSKNIDENIKNSFDL